MSANNSANDCLRIIPLGGLAEIGKNITAIESPDGIIVIDCGITFPREEGVFGVDIVLPDFQYLVDNASKLLGVVLTHGHEDHIGSLPYLMAKCKVPRVLATRFTMQLAKARVDEHGLIGATDWVEIVAGTEHYELGEFQLEFVQVAHSIPDAVAVAIHSDYGTIFHTGDIKLDASPIDGKPTDLAHISEIASDGIDLYLGDSTGADVPGHTKSERSLGGPLRDLVFRAPGRVFVSSFSSNIHRVQQVVDIANESGRSICIIGRSLMRNTNIARNLGILDVGSAKFIKPAALAEAGDKVLVLCTGSQGEPLSALTRIAWGTHPVVEPIPSDSYIFSSRIIPGNEHRVHGLINQLSRVGCHIFHAENATVHVSGHAASDELRMLLQLVQPSAFMPVHGEWRHLRAHAGLALQVGMDQDSILLAENGWVVKLKDGSSWVSDERVHVGRVHVDRHSNEDIIESIMEDRQQLSGDGLLVVVAHGDGGDGLDLISRGFVAEGDVQLFNDAREAATKTLRAQRDLGDGDVRRALSDSVSEVVYERTGKSPLIVPILID